MKRKIMYSLIVFISAFVFTNVKAENKNINIINESKQVGYINVYADEDSVNCSSLGKFKEDLQSIFNAFKIVAPILTLVLSTYEFVTAITSKAAEGLQESVKKFTTRLILVIVLYLLPVFLNLILNLAIPGSGTCIH